MPAISNRVLIINAPLPCILLSVNIALCYSIVKLLFAGLIRNASNVVFFAEVILFHLGFPTDSGKCASSREVGGRKLKEKKK